MVDLLINIKDQCPQNIRLMGLDVGKKTIGIALSDPGHSIATPLATIKRSRFMRDMEALAEVVHDYEVGGFIIGLPVNMDGSEGRRAQSVRDFAQELEKYFLSRPSSLLKQGSGQDTQPDPGFRRNDGGGVWVALWDERLSTVSVEGFVDKLVDKRKTKVESKSSGLIDKLAAQQILQGALEHKKISNTQTLT